MISAAEAKALYQLPPHTEEEIEEQIRRAAKRENYTCFDTKRMTPELIKKLEMAGFGLDLTHDAVIVRWGK